MVKPFKEFVDASETRTHDRLVLKPDAIALLAHCQSKVGALVAALAS